MAIQLIVGQGVTHNRIFLRKCARWSDLSTSASEVPPNTPASRSTAAARPPAPRGPPRCPMCGHAATPFDVRISTLLDLIGELEQALTSVKCAAEDLIA
jgi:hypothetical protein